MLKRVALVFVALAIVGLGFLPSGAAAQTPPPDTSSLLVKLVAGLTADDQAAVIARNGGTETSAIAALRLHVVQVPTAELADTIARYAADPQVQHVEENKVRRTEFLSNDPFVTGQWALPQIGWDLVFGVVAPTGTAKVAILDTGIDATHPDLAGRVVAGTSILDGSNGMTDSHGHGTQIAGIVAANTDNSAGVAGVAFAGVQVMPVTVLDANGEGRDSDVIAGVLWAADNGADVILMAFSNPGFSPNLQDAIDYAWSKGAVLVAAVGNDGVGTATFPAGDRGVMGASGTDTADALLGYSNFGQAAFLAAPGDNIATTALGGGYVAVSGTSTSAAILAGVAGFLKAVDPTLTNGMIVGRMARTADPAGTQEQTGNGRVNMARALEDTGRDELQPAGADPIGAGGPFVGPYVIANNRLLLTGGLTITAPAGATDKIIDTNQAFTVQVTISNQNNGGDQPSTWSGIGASLTVPAGWGKTADLSGGTLGNATDGGTVTCGAAVTTTSCTYTWNVTAPGTTSTSNSISVVETGTPSAGTCTGGNKCTDTALISGIAVVNPASLSITAFTAAQQGAPGDTTVMAGQSITLSMTVANGAAPRATATGVAPSTVTVTSTGTASATCGSAASASIAAGSNQTFALTCGSVSGNGTLKFTASASGTDENSGSTVSAGSNDSNVVTVDSTVPTMGLTPAADSYPVPFSFSWNITDPTAGGVSSDVKTSTCSVTVNGGTPVTACSGMQSLAAGGPYSVVVSADDNAGNHGSQSASYTVVSDTTPPVITPHISGTLGANGWYTSDVTVTWDVTDPDSAISSSTGCGSVTLTTETTGTLLTCSATSAGGTSSQPVTIKLDKTPPTSVSQAVTVGTLGANGWYTSDVTVHTSGTETISTPLVCTADQVQTAETTGTAFNGSCTNNAGLSTNAALLTVKLDKTGPVVNLTVTAGTAGANGWYTSDVTVHADGTDSISSPVTCTADQVQTAETTGAVFNGSCTNNAGLSTNAAPLTVKLDKTPPTGVSQAVTVGTLGANGWHTSDVTVHTSGTETISTPLVCTADQVQTAETTGTAFNGSCTNNAGLSTNAALLTVKLDKTGPVVNLTVTAGTAGANGWYTSDVTVHADGTDSISSPVTCTADQVQTAETTGTAFNGSCTNNAGLSTNAAPLTVKLDKTPPTGVSQAVTVGTLGANGWYTSDVTVHTSGTETISTPLVCTADQVQTAETTGTAFNGSCTNNAGLSTNAALLTVKLDKTGPVVNLTVTAGTAGANGWYTSDVTVHATGTDSISSPVTCTADQVQTTETTGAVFNGSCTNNAGLSTNAALLTVKLDKTGPTGVSLSVTAGMLGDNGWYTSDVTVHATGTDSISSPVTCTADQFQTAETTGATFNGSCTNDAGLSTNAASLTIKLDKTKPTVQVTGVADGATYVLGSVPAAGCSTTDTLSGVAIFATVNVTGGAGGGVGTFTATCSGGKDKAGNVAADVSVSYSVDFSFTGFFQPIDNGMWNGAKAGSAIPTKFSLHGNQGLSIFAAGSPVSQQISCDSSAPVDDIEQTVTAGNSSLSYDPGSDQYNYVWKTDKGWVGQCRKLDVVLKDGTHHVAIFKFK